MRVRNPDYLILIPDTELDTDTGYLKPDNEN